MFIATSNIYTLCLGNQLELFPALTLQAQTQTLQLWFSIHRYSAVFELLALEFNELGTFILEFLHLSIV